MTAVEWLIQHLTAIGELNIPDGYNIVTEIVRQAIEMEKQQIIDAYETNRDIDTIQTAEEYYDEIYKPSA